VLYASTPLWVAVFSGPMLREKVGLPVWAGIAVGFAGVAVLLQAGIAWRNPTALLVIVGAVSYAVALLRLRRLSGHETSEAIALHMSLTAGVVMLAIALPSMRPVRAAAYLPLAAGAIAGGFGQLAVGRAYARAPAARMSALTYSGVLFTYVAEAALFHRAPGLVQCAGALLVVAGGVLVSGIMTRAAVVVAE
jgi:drug/metabolite transporter (DMT)-like permease